MKLGLNLCFGTARTSARGGACVSGVGGFVLGLGAGGAGGAGAGGCVSGGCVNCAIIQFVVETFW